MNDLQGAETRSAYNHIIKARFEYPISTSYNMFMFTLDIDWIIT